MKKTLSLFLACLLLVCTAVPAFAAEVKYSAQLADADVSVTIPAGVQYELYGSLRDFELADIGFSSYEIRNGGKEDSSYDEWRGEYNEILDSKGLQMAAGNDSFIFGGEFESTFGGNSGSPRTYDLTGNCTIELTLPSGVLKPTDTADNLRVIASDESGDNVIEVDSRSGNKITLQSRKIGVNLTICRVVEVRDNSDDQVYEKTPESGNVRKVTIRVPAGTTDQNGRPITAIDFKVTDSGSVSTDKDVISGVVSDLGYVLNGDGSSMGFTPFSIDLMNGLDILSNTTTSKPITIEVEFEDSSFIMQENVGCIISNHNGQLRAISLDSLTKNGDVYTAIFTCSQFSPFMMVSANRAVSNRTNNTTVNNDDATPKVEMKEFVDRKMQLYGGEFVDAKTIAQASKDSEIYTIIYKGKTYQFKGNSLATPSAGIVYYTSDEVIDLVLRISGTAVTAHTSNVQNPETGVSDFVRLPVGLLIVGALGILAVKSGKKKSL